MMVCLERFEMSTSAAIYIKLILATVSMLKPIFVLFVLVKNLTVFSVAIFILFQLLSDILQISSQQKLEIRPGFS